MRRPRTRHMVVVMDTGLESLRTAAKYSCERKRYRKQKAKWSNGARPLYGRKEIGEDGRCRPAQKLRKAYSCCPICSGEASEAYRRAGNKEFAKFQIEEALDNPYGYDFDYCYDDWLNHQCFSDDACWYQEVEEDSFMWPSMHEAGGGYEFNPCYDDFVDNPSYSGGFSCCGLAEADEEYCFTRASSYEVGHGYEFEGCDNYSHEDYPEDRDDDYHEGWYDDSLAEPYCTEDWSCPEWTKEQFEEYYRMWPTPHEAAQLDLGELLDVARNHFEMQETEKLLREYDFVDDSGNEDVGGIFTDDEYEVVDYVLA